MIIKHIPEDFIVEEIPNVADGWLEDGKYNVLLLKKVNLNTEEAIRIMAHRLGIRPGEIKYAGTKDRHASTIQYVSLPSSVKFSDFEDEKLSVRHVGYTNEPLSLGSLKGNRFTITVRDITSRESESFTSKQEDGASLNNFTVPNYFDEQRFSKNNMDVGLHIVKHDLKKACESLLLSEGNYEDEARVHLAAMPNDYVGALVKIPKKILLMFVHAVQSYIFNEALCRILIEVAEKNGIGHTVINLENFRLVFYTNPADYKYVDAGSLMLPGFNAVIDHHSKQVMDELGITPRDFIIRTFPDISVEGAWRDVFVTTGIISENLGDRIILRFELPKGSYATIVVKGLFN